MNPDIKPGLATTEFWLAFAVAVLGGLSVAFVDSPYGKVAGVIAAALTSLGYGLSRGMAKGGGS